MSKVEGICHLCGQYAELSFEHVPPKSANNKDRARLLTGKEIFNTQKLRAGKSLRYINQQQGAGNYTLCKDCNNNTGDWYAKEYIKFANEIGYILTNQIDLNTAKGIGLDSDKLYFQRIIKQILCMFLSTIQPEYAMTFNDIREYVLNKESTAFNDKKYRVSMYLLKNYEISHSGVVGLLVKENNQTVIRKVAVMNLYPIGFILEIDPPKKTIPDTTNITKFTTLRYDELQNVVMTFSITEKYSLHNFTKKFIEENSNRSEYNGK